jgi:thiosulfate/3-mercaptopyruvate sulfurtransferase
LPAPDQFAAFLAAHGVNKTSRIVAYDDAGGLYAARLWWLARWIGFKQVALLDGGDGRCG